MPHSVYSVNIAFLPNDAPMRQGKCSICGVDTVCYVRATATVERETKPFLEMLVCLPCEGGGDDDESPSCDAPEKVEA